MRRVPGFARAREEDPSFMSHGTHDTPYLVFGDFGFFLRRELDGKGTVRETHTRLSIAFQLIDEMLTSPDPEVVNLIQVGVLEILAENPDTLKVIENHLSPPGKEKLEEWIRDSQQV